MSRKKLELERIEYAIYQIHELGYDISFANDKRIEFEVLGHLVIFYPYSGWGGFESVKIIGNIHETPELLKKETTL